MDELKINGLKPFFLPETVTAVSGSVWLNEMRFDKGKRYLISASSGRGKSSLLSYIFGERTDYKGQICFDNRDITTLKQSDWKNIRTTQLSYVFQGLRLFSELTALENIMLKNKITEYKSPQDIDRMIEQSGLQDKRNEKTGRLSFGQQQRIAIIRALCQPFDFLLLDEPFSHLDEQNIKIISELITDELNARNAGMLLCSLGYGYLFDYDETRCMDSKYV
jgi:ABC-type lipoprotein export system ATPase subunit